MDYLVKNSNTKKKYFLIIISIVSTLIILLGSVYAFFTYYKSAEAFTLTSNTITARFTSGTNEINFTNAYPISDSYAIDNLANLDYIDFTVSGSASNPLEAVTYEIFLTQVDGNTLSSDFIKTYITDEDGVPVKAPMLYSNLPATTYANEPTGKVALRKTYAGTFTKSYRLYIWLDENYTQNTVSQTFGFYVNIYAYNNTSSNATVTTITYNPMGGSVIPTSEEKDSNYGDLPVPTKDGYNFDGWYLEDTYETKVIPQTAIPDVKTLTLYAKWTLDSISNITFVSYTDKVLVDKTLTTTLTYLGQAETISYSTSDAEVATVDENGVITGVGEGSATITVTLTDYEGHSVTSTMNVTIFSEAWAENIGYTPPEGVTCSNDAECDNLQLMLDRIAEMLD